MLCNLSHHGCLEKVKAEKNARNMRKRLLSVSIENRLIHSVRPTGWGKFFVHLEEDECVR